MGSIAELHVEGEPVPGLIQHGHRPRPDGVVRELPDDAITRLIREALAVGQFLQRWRGVPRSPRPPPRGLRRNGCEAGPSRLRGWSEKALDPPRATRGESPLELLAKLRELLLAQRRLDQGSLEAKHRVFPRIRVQPDEPPPRRSRSAWATVDGEIDVVEAQDPDEIAHPPPRPLSSHPVRPAESSGLPSRKPNKNKVLLISLQAEVAHQAVDLGAVQAQRPGGRGNGAAIRVEGRLKLLFGHPAAGG